MRLFFIPTTYEVHNMCTFLYKLWCTPIFFKRDKLTLFFVDRLVNGKKLSPRPLRTSSRSYKNISSSLGYQNRSIETVYLTYVKMGTKCLQVVNKGEKI